MIGNLIERKFNAKLVRDLYKVQTYSKDQSEYYDTDGQIPIIPDESLESPPSIKNSTNGLKKSVTN